MSNEEADVLREQLAVASDRAQSWKNMHDLIKSNADRVRTAALEMLAELEADYAHGVSNGYWPEMAPKLDGWRAALNMSPLPRHGGRLPEPAGLMALLARLVGNHDTRCRLDHHGYCQEHNFASPCPVPEAQRLTGVGVRYVPTVGR